MDAKPALGGSVWRGPLVPVALAFSAGILLDRHASIPLPGSLFATVIMLAAWMAACSGRSPGLPLVYLALATAASGAAWHHYRRDVLAADDISLLVEEKPRVVQLRGLLEQEPLVSRHLPDPLRSVQRGDGPSQSTTALLKVTECRLRADWLPISGRVQFLCPESLADLHAGDTVEIIGRLTAPEEPANPGERNFVRELRDQGVRAVVWLRDGSGATRLEPAGAWSPVAWAARVRGWGVREVGDALPGKVGGLAKALLLGDESGLDRDSWDKYKQTGVVHVLVISGQHLVVLGAFLWFWLRLAHVRERRGIVVVILFLWTYAVVTGLRPSSLRAAVMVTALAGGLLLRRPVLGANALALAWLAVLFLNPGDIANLGCQLSFLCVACLHWNSARQRARQAEVDPREQLIDASRPPWLRALRGLGRAFLATYLLTACMWLVTLPLIASRMHVVPAAALLIGPPVVCATSLALIAGFLFLLTAPVRPVAALFAWPTRFFLSGCDWLVDGAGRSWLQHGYVADVADWWLWGFYLLLGAGLLWEGSRRHWRWMLLTGTGWLGLGLVVVGLRSRQSDELRVTFLAVGHGGCTVIETPDGRTLLYDVGSLRGPDVGRRQVASYLWHRGIRRIDEVFLSHADLDHFNGLRDLLERFTIGKVTRTPTFPQKDNAAVRLTLELLERYGVETRIVSAGDRLAAGEVTIDVLHPPKEGPKGVENVRSLTLLVGHGRHRFLLTGDLEGEGLRRLLERKPMSVDVLMAPHHGSRRVEGADDLMKWARPQVVVSCQREPRTLSRLPNPYETKGVHFLGTWPHGAVTVRSHASGLIVETFVTKERFVVRSSKRDERERREPTGR